MCFAKYMNATEHYVRNSNNTNLKSYTALNNLQLIGVRVQQPLQQLEAKEEWSGENQAITTSFEQIPHVDLTVAHLQSDLLEVPLFKKTVANVAELKDSKIRWPTDEVELHDIFLNNNDNYNDWIV